MRGKECSVCAARAGQPELEHGSGLHTWLLAKEEDLCTWKGLADGF